MESTWTKWLAALKEFKLSSVQNIFLATLLLDCAICGGIFWPRFGLDFHNWKKST